MGARRLVVRGVMRGRRMVMVRVVIGGQRVVWVGTGRVGGGGGVRREQGEAVDCCCCRRCRGRRGGMRVLRQGDDGKGGMRFE